ncbi:hypothetical protein AGMMS49936_06670 [Endomicrobiia bacterium]|nr:hypothetical protein AGMMS49936_06670 [Endomicrobiia bacterium]
MKKKMIIIKGKAFKNDIPKGILRVYHNRILYVLTLKWEEDGCKYMEYSDNHDIKICYCNVSVKEVIDILGYKNSSSLGGRQYIKIKRAIDDLRTSPYYFDFSEFNGKLENVTFHFLQTAMFVKYKNNNIPTTVRIEFSPMYSDMLLSDKRYVEAKRYVQLKIL